MTGAVVVIVGITTLLILMLVMQLNLSAPPKDEEEDEDRPALPAPTLEARIERYIGLLNYGDDATAAEAIRHILSMGPGILPVLLKQINRLERRPSALSPRCQLRLEELLVAFGLVTYLECGELLRYVHRASPVFPAMVRIFVGIGPNLVVEIVRNPIVDTFSVLSPLLYRLGPSIVSPLHELLAVKPNQVSDDLLMAALPIFADQPALLAELLAEAGEGGELRLCEALARWHHPVVMEHLSRRWAEAPSPLRELAMVELAVDACARHLAGEARALDLIEEMAAGSVDPEDIEGAQTGLLLLDALPLVRMLAVAREVGLPLHGLDGLSEVDGADIERLRQLTEGALAASDGGEIWRRRLGVCALGQVIDDPRAVERLIALAEDPMSPLGGLALLQLARSNKGPLEELMAGRVRAAEIGEGEIFHLRLCALARLDLFRPLLSRVLRSDSPRAVGVAAVLLSVHGPSTEAVLKALGRHRYSPIEGTIAPLVWARWQQVGPQIADHLDSSDREVRQGAVDILAGLGRPADAARLLEQVKPESELIDSLLNAVEMIGPDAAPQLASFVTTHPDLARNYSLERRLSLLQLLAGASARASAER